MNAPFDPVEGLIVPDMYDSESICLKITFCPKLTFFFMLLNDIDFTSQCSTRTDTSMIMHGFLKYECLMFHPDPSSQSKLFEVSR